MYLQYCEKVPTAIGKGFLTRFVGKRYRYAEYCIGNLKIELNPVALLDRYLIEGTDINPVLSKEMEGHLRPNDVFIDIGANIGFFSILAEKRYHAEVFSFEPSARELARFYRNAALNHCQKITCFPYAVGSSEETLYLSLTGEDNPSMNHIVRLNSNNEVEVNVRTIPSLIPPARLEKAAICKIDVEGFEMEVLEGLQEIMGSLEKCRFVVEVSPEYLKKNGASVSQIYDFFRSHGYKAVYGKQDAFQWDEVFVPKK